jgi:hypothetical protein
MFTLEGFPAVTCFLEKEQIYIQDVSEGIVNILGGGSIDYSE